MWMYLSLCEHVHIVYQVCVEVFFYHFCLWFLLKVLIICRLHMFKFCYLLSSNAQS
jgi:hypothetical protein